MPSTISPGFKFQGFSLLPAFIDETFRYIIHPIFKAGDVARAGKCAFFSLEVELKDGRDLAARDKTGTCIFNTPVMKKNISSLFDIVFLNNIF